MANREKAELKCSIFQSEIEELKKQQQNKSDSSCFFRGQRKAYEECLVILNTVFYSIKDAMDWEKKTDEEKEAILKENPKAKPQVELTEAEGYKSALLFRPVQTVFSSKIKKVSLEPEMLEAQKNTLGEQIARLERLIAEEQTKNFDGYDIEKENEPVEPEKNKKQPKMQVVKKATKKKGK